MATGECYKQLSCFGQDEVVPRGDAIGLAVYVIDLTENVLCKL